MANMFNNLEKGFNDFKKQASKIAENVGEEVGKVTNNVAKETGKFMSNAGKVVADITDGTVKVAGEVGNNIGKTADKVAKDVGESAGKVDLFNSKLRRKSVDDYNDAVELYEKVAEDVETNAKSLYDLRKIAIIHVHYVEQHINQLVNTPKEFKVDLQKINFEITTFENKENEIKEAEKQAKVAAGGSGAGATLGALGVAVATMGPTAAMGVATTFGVASTGTAISALSGAAANSAALAWLGGGSLAVGGGGMSAGTTLLALAGPVGWTIAGAAGVTAVCSGIFASHKNKETADKLLGERQNLEEVIRKFDTMDASIQSLIEVTQSQIDGVEKANAAVSGRDYNEFTKEEKLQAGLLVNSTLTLAQLVNKELKLND